MLKMIRHVILFLVILLNSVIFGEVVFVNRTCNSYNSTPMFNYELNKLEGKWYEIAKYGKPEKCTTDYMKYDLYRHHLNVTHHTGPYKGGHNTTIIIAQRFNYGMDLEITENGASFPAKILTTNYYDNPVIWSCTDLTNGSQSIQKLVILSKYNDVKLNNLGAVIQVLNNTGISKDNIELNMVDHSSNSCNFTSNNKNTTHYGNSTHGHSSSGGKVTTVLNVPVIPLLFVISTYYTFKKSM